MRKILLLDDNTMSCENSLEVLEKVYEVHKCKEILSAVRRIGLVKYDLFIIDLMMPTKGLDNLDEFSAGFNFYNKYIKNDYKETPVLFWTNLTDGSFKAFQADSGRSNLYYLQKSDDDNALLEFIKNNIKL